MSELVKNITDYVNIRVPLEQLELYYSILAALSDYGEDMLKDCKASCTDKDSSIIECFNMFSGACAKYETGDIKGANVIFNYVKSTLELKYKNIIIPSKISFPVKEENVTIYFDFKKKEYYVEEGIVIPLESIDIIGPDEIEGVSQEYTYTLHPDDTTQMGIVWEVIQGEGSQYAYIDSTTGVLYIKSNASNSLVKIKATSITNPEISAIKEITCTYDNETEEVDCEVNVIYDSSIAEFRTNRTILATVVNSTKDILRLELHNIDVVENDILIDIANYQSSKEFNINLNVIGHNKYYVEAVFYDGTIKKSNIIDICAYPCCFIGEATPTESSYYQVIGNSAFKQAPMLDIASVVGKEYPVNVTRDGNYIYIIVPRLSGHMQIDEVRLDETNMSEGFYFDVDTTVSDIYINGIQYGVYGLKLNNKGFVAQANPYRLLITKPQEL